jgi:hypothetical protein
MADSTVVGVVSVICSTIVGVAGLVLGYRAKNQPFRQVLYQQQLDLLLASSADADQLHSRCLAVAMNRDKEKQAALRQELMAEGRRFNSTIARIGALLPLEVWNSYVTYQEQVSAFAGERASFENVNDSFIRLVGPTRKFLGVDALSEENVKHFGEHKQIAAGGG